MCSGIVQLRIPWIYRLMQVLWVWDSSQYQDLPIGQPDGRVPDAGSAHGTGRREIPRGGVVQLCKERVPRRIVGRVSGVAIPAPCDQNLPICEQGRRVLSAVRDQAASRSENASSGVVEFCARCGSPAPSRLRGSSSDQNSAVAQQSGGV